MKKRTKRKALVWFTTKVATEEKREGKNDPRHWENSSSIPLPQQTNLVCPPVMLLLLLRKPGARHGCPLTQSHLNLILGSRQAVMRWRATEARDAEKRERERKKREGKGMEGGTPNV